MDTLTSSSTSLRSRAGDEVELLWSDVASECLDSGLEARQSWKLLCSLLEMHPLAGVQKTEEYASALERYVKDMLRTAYWRGFHVGCREGAGGDATVEVIGAMAIRKRDR